MIEDHWPRKQGRPQGAACLVILERKSMPLCSSSTLMGASVLALSTSFVFFACRHALRVAC